MAKLTAVYGPMFAGKTTWIINKINELEATGKKSLVFKPRLDDRYGKEAELHAHSGMVGDAILVDENNPTEMLGVWAEENEQHTVIVIDEAMFFTPQIVEVVREMLARDLQVIVAGLDTNFRKEPFGPMPSLIKLAHEKTELFSKCYKCGNQAQYTARLRGGTNDIEVGADDLYQPACIKCHTILEDNTTKSTPYFNLRLPAQKNDNIRIEIAADSLRVGKTTAVKVIADGMRERGKQVVESYEDWQHNPYLKKSYLDPKKNFVESQKWFIKRKWQQLVDGKHCKGIFIQDVAPEMDFGYAATNLRLSRMSRKHFDEYNTYFQGLDWSKAPKPDLLVYLTISDKELIKRANKSRREFENVEPKYFLTMKKINRKWLTAISQIKNRGYKLLKINTDKLDFANDEQAKKELVRKVCDLILEKT